MERIMIIGCGGSGKSTLARQLGEKLGLPVVHLDQIWWRPNWVHISKEEFDSAIRAEMRKDRWIMDGNFNRTIPERLGYCDTVIYLDFNRMTCLLSWIGRVLSNWGTSRPDMSEGCNEWFDPEMAQWIWNYNKTNRENYYKILNETEGVQTIVLKNRRAVKQFLKQVDG